MKSERDGKLSRRLLLAAALAAPAIHVPRALFGRGASIQIPEPHLGHLVIVTFDSLGTGGLTFGGDETLSRFGSRAVSISPVFADSDVGVAAATSLMLGSTPKLHGVRVRGAIVSHECWSLPRAAAAAGYRTIALSTTDLAAAAGIPGFDESLSAASAPNLVTVALERLRAHAWTPLFLWLHLPTTVSGVGLQPTLGAVLREMEALDTIWRTTLVVTGLRGLGGRHEEALLVPFLAQYPGAIGHGSRPRGLVALSDVAPGLRLQLKLPGPDEFDGQAPNGRGSTFIRASAGGAPFDHVRCEGAFGLVVRGPGANGLFPGFRAFLPAEAGGDLSRAKVSRIAEPDTGISRLEAASDAEREHGLKLLQRAL